MISFVLRNMEETLKTLRDPAPGYEPPPALIVNPAVEIPQRYDQVITFFQKMIEGKGDKYNPVDRIIIKSYLFALLKYCACPVDFNPPFLCWSDISNRISPIAHPTLSSKCLAKRAYLTHLYYDKTHFSRCIICNHPWHKGVKIFKNLEVWGSYFPLSTLFSNYGHDKCVI